MRKLLVFVLLMISAATARAQEPVPSEPAEPVRTTDVQASPAAADALPGPAATDASKGRTTDVPKVDLKTRSATAAAIDAATVRAPIDFDQPAQDITAPQNFWWLVGAIVLAGIILAVLL